MSQQSPAAQSLGAKVRAVLGLMLLLFVAYLFFSSCSGSSEAGGDKASANPSPSALARFKATVSDIEVVNPASVRVFVQVTNTGEVTATPQCTVAVRDPSSTYTGFEVFEVQEPLKPGRVSRFEGVIVVEKEGAMYVTKSSVKCQATM